MALLDSNIQRRDFLKGGAAAAAALTTVGLFGCSEKTEQGSLSQTGSPDGEELTPHLVASDEAVLGSKGEWKAVECWGNCGGRCVNKVFVSDDVVLRHKTDDDSEDTNDTPQHRGCLRGVSQVQQVYNVDRLKYPMKRKNWQPGGGENAHGELRGQDEWERISWDEAIDLASAEIKRIYEEYGPRSVMAPYPPGDNFLELMGGSLRYDGMLSYGHWSLCQGGIGTNPAPLFLGVDMDNTNDRRDMVNADVVVMHGMNLAWSSSTATYYFLLAKEAGVQFVSIGPSYNLSASALGARWIRVRPASDTAFLLAVAYEMLRLDEEKSNIIDWDFLHKYSVGFDAESMPDDAVLDENFRGYVLGEYDGVPKTPQWASEICGTPVEDITWYAETIGKQNNVMLFHSYAATRCNGAENMSQLFLTIGCMGGHMGRSGNCCGTAYHSRAGNDGPQVIQYGTPSAFGGAQGTLEKPFISAPEWWSSALEGKYTYRGRGSIMSPQNFFEPEEIIEFEPKMYFNTVTNGIQTRMDINSAIKALRKMDFVFSIDYQPSATARYADIVLPCTTPWEGNLDPNRGELWLSHSFMNNTMSSQRRDYITFPSPVSDALYEAKPDEWIMTQIMNKLGLDPAVLYPITQVQTYYDRIAGATLLGEDGEWKTLVTITQDDIDAWGVVGSPQEGIIGFNELLSRGSYQVPVKENDAVTGCIGYKAFIDDPVANPRDTKSGKFEIYCQTKADSINVMDPSLEPMKPYPTYIRARNNYEDTFSNWETKEKGTYPFQMYQPHYLQRSHTEFDNCTWTREAFADPIFISTEDAAAKGIQTGDTVIVFNEQGKILRRASVISSIMPGCLACPHGRHVDIDPETGIDRGGSENVLLGKGQQSVYFKQVEGYNSCLVDIEKYDGEPIPENYDRKPVIMMEE